jgi:flagellar assembly factor FliW
MSDHLPTTATVEITDLPIIEFVTPLPGFPAHDRFVLVRTDEAGLLYTLSSADDPAVRFLVVPPAPFFPEYVVDVDDETLTVLGAPAEDDLLPLVVVNAGDGSSPATANLLAPIVVAQSKLRAVQLVQHHSGLPLRAPLMIN